MSWIIQLAHFVFYRKINPEMCFLVFAPVVKWRLQALAFSTKIDTESRLEFFLKKFSRYFVWQLGVEMGNLVPEAASEKDNTNRGLEFHYKRRILKKDCFSFLLI